MLKSSISEKFSGDSGPSHTYTLPDSSYMTKLRTDTFFVASSSYFL